MRVTRILDFIMKVYTNYIHPTNILEEPINAYQYVLHLSLEGDLLYFLEALHYDIPALRR